MGKGPSTALSADGAGSDAWAEAGLRGMSAAMSITTVTADGSGTSVGSTVVYHPVASLSCVNRSATRKLSATSTKCQNSETAMTAWRPDAFSAAVTVSVSGRSLCTSSSAGTNRTAQKTTRRRRPSRRPSSSGSPATVARKREDPSRYGRNSSVKPRSVSLSRYSPGTKPLASTRITTRRRSSVRASSVGGPSTNSKPTKSRWSVSGSPSRSRSGGGSSYANRLSGT